MGETDYTHTYRYGFTFEGPHVNSMTEQKVCEWNDGNRYDWDGNKWIECVEDEEDKELHLPPGWASDVNGDNTTYCNWRTEEQTYTKPGPLVAKRRRRLTNQDLIDRFIRESLR